MLSFANSMDPDQQVLMKPADWDLYSFNSHDESIIDNEIAPLDWLEIS